MQRFIAVNALSYLFECRRYKSHCHAFKWWLLYCGAGQRIHIYHSCDDPGRTFISRMRPSLILSTREGAYRTKKKKTIFHNNLGNSHIVFHKCTSSFLVRTREDEHCRHLRHSSAHTSNMHTTRTANGECYSLRCTSKYTTPIISHLTCNNCCGDVRMGPSKATTTTTNHYTAKFVHA